MKKVMVVIYLNNGKVILTDIREVEYHMFRSAIVYEIKHCKDFASILNVTIRPELIDYFIVKEVE